jgi:1,2-diacylglycerol 3-beta-glucosyltransferase
MMTWVALVLLVLYLIKIQLFRSGAVRASRVVRTDVLPSVSVIVAARNEEANIGACLASLAALDYPADLLEIIVIDDQSEDATGRIIDDWRAQMPALVPMRTEGTVHNLRGKANAVAQAITRARGEIILTTDADCAVPRAWVRETVALFTPAVGCVCGFTLQKVEGAFSGMQSVDWAYLLTIASAGVGWGMPLSAVGNNMAFRRAAYDDVGGYAGVGFSVTEDFALFKAIGYKTAWEIRYPVADATLAWSEPCATAGDLYRQKKRWGRGGLDIHPIGFAIMSVGWLMNALLLAGPFIGVSWTDWLIAFAGKSIGDIWLLTLPLERLGQRRLFRYFALFELYYLFYVTLLPFVVLLTGKVVWKGRRL